MRRFQLHYSPDGGGAPADISIKSAADVRSAIGAAVKRVSELGDRTDGLEKLISDTADAVERLSADTKRVQFNDARNKDYGRFFAPDGSVGLVGHTQEGGAVVKSIDFAGVKVDVPVEGLFDSVPADEWQADLQKMALAHKIGGYLGADKRKSAAKILAHMAKAPSVLRAAAEGAVKKAMADVTGQGGDWVPDILASTVFRDFEVSGIVAGQFQTIDMPSPDYIVPKLTVGARPFIAGATGTDDPAQFTASQLTTDKQTVSALKFAVLVKAEDNIAEDSIVPMLPMIMQELAAAQADGFDDAIINGDNTDTSSDARGSWNARLRWGTANAGSADHRRGFVGLRHLAFDRSGAVDQGSGQTVTKILEELVGGMGENAASNLVMFVSPEVFFKKIMTDDKVMTVDKFGPNASILRGQVAAVGGVPIVMTRWLTADLAATGLYTGSGAKSGVVVADRSAFRIYSRRALMIESAKDITRGQYNMVATSRRTFTTLSASSRKVSMFGYNWL